MSTLSYYVRTQADWRRAKAEEFPDDPRNEQSARALEDLADYIDVHLDAGQLPEVEAIDVHMDEGGLGSYPTAQYSVSRYGFGYEIGSGWQHSDFIDELLLDIQSDGYTMLSQDPDLEAWGEDVGYYAFEVQAAKDGVALPRRYWELRPKWFEAEAEEAVKTYYPVTAE